MSKFETTETLIYEYLIDEVLVNILFAEDRVNALINENDFENAKYEELQLVKDKEKLKHLREYLKDAEKSHSNRPNYVELGWYDEFTEKKISDQLYAIQLDDSEYYYKPTEITLNNWRKMEEGVVHIFNNLTLVREGETLLSKYPQETIWHEINEEHNADMVVFDAYGHKKLFLK